MKAFFLFLYGKITQNQYINLMRPLKYIPLLSLIFIVNLLTIKTRSCSAQPSVLLEDYKNKVFDTNIRSVMLYPAGIPLSEPVIRLNTDDKLELHFDNLSDVRKNYHYTLVHCNVLWEPSLLDQSEYLQGHTSGRITNVESSFNTTYEYFHYSLNFPEEEIYPFISGNYVIVVYEEYKADKPVLIRRFYVTESLVDIVAAVRQPSGDGYFTSQEIELSVNYKDYSIHSPATDLKISILQNGNPFSERVLSKPRFISTESLIYGGNGEIVFDGVNEFRYFNTKSMKYESENIISIDFRNPYYHVFLKPDEPRALKPYFTVKELNGKFFIDKEGAQNNHTDADYVYVHFSMPAQVPFTDGDIYITGAFCDWAAGDENRLVYNAEKRRYEASLLLKQGYYNYLYTYREKGAEKTDIGFMEGNHYETENEYLILVYHADSRWKYDRIIAVKKVSSVQR